MKHLARGVLVVVLLLASVGAASAECAWVLWAQVTQFKEDFGGYFQTSSAVVRAYPTQRRCETDKPKDLVYENARFKYVCLPDTVDPREPKGK